MRILIRASARILLGCLSAAVIGVGGERAAVAQDADNGQRLAAERCVSCHAVAGDHSQPNKLGKPRTLESIANTPNVDAGTIVAFLKMPHARMPNLALKAKDIDDIAAYIARMKH